MGRASSGKKVARVASTGGGRTSRGRTPVMWYASLALIILVGTMVVYTSRNARAVRVNDPTPPRANRDHYHAAYGIDVCGLILPPIAIDSDPLGIHTHKNASGSGGDGVIHIHPFSSASSGKNATLGVFADAVGLTITSNTLQVPGGKKYENGDDCGNNKPGLVRVAVDGKEVTGDPRKIHFARDRMLIMIAFLPKDDPIPSPPSAVNLDSLTDVPGSSQTPPPTPPGGSTESTAPGSTASSAPTTSGTAPPTSGSAPPG